MKTQNSLSHERGIAMLLELLLVALVLTVVGAAVINMNRNQATTPTTASVPVSSTVANGKVDNVVNALILDSAGDSTSSGQEGATIPGTDTSTGNAQAASGSVDENSL
jgi:hypothetical protein